MLIVTNLKNPYEVVRISSQTATMTKLQYANVYYYDKHPIVFLGTSPYPAFSKVKNE